MGAFFLGTEIEQLFLETKEIEKERKEEWREGKKEICHLCTAMWPSVE